ncbi:hypothetical protein [Acinetobacter soli]|uniref:hypothetical protein n=1 Tax=Acinetobacter soli TaxID=487316 RepID=UPI001250C260|nr:hypothetical protein [Acinetobacter soli]
MKILIACEYSGVVREAFAKLGHDATSCDFLPTEQPGKHYQGDVRDVLHHDWDMMIAHPECTYLTNAGVCHLHTDPKRWPKLFDAAAFFKELLNATHIPKRAIENPIMHGYAKTLIGGVKQTQVIQPWMFGHMEQKATCLWLCGLDPLKATNNVKAEMMRLPKNQRERLHYLPPGPERWKERSRTYQGIADAMAEQWGGLRAQQDLFGGAA